MLVKGSEGCLNEEDMGVRLYCFCHFYVGLKFFANK